MASRPKLSIVTSVFDDWDGLYFTLQHFNIETKAQNKARTQIVVVNNENYQKNIDIALKHNRQPVDPGTPIRVLCDRLNNSSWQNVKYVQDNNMPQGTSPGRERAIKEADGEWVLCLDSHVMMPSRSIHYFYQFIDKDQPDGLFAGLLVSDDLQHSYTHFNNLWRGGMWGIWGAAWSCTCNKYNFTTKEDGDKLVCSTLDMDYAPLKSCPYCEKEFPQNAAWAGHEKILSGMGYKHSASTQEMFEIPGQGLGLFFFKKKDWQGFHPESRQFGGEEMYIHEKFRKANMNSYCVPNVRWIHRFHRSGGLPYPASEFSKVRNYVLEFQEMGWDLEPIRKHFVEDQKVFPQEHWDYLLEDPEEHYQPEGDCGTCNKKADAHPIHLHELFDIVNNVPRDMDEHCEAIREYASKCEHVTDISERKESCILLASGKPKRLLSYNQEYGDGLILSMKKGITVLEGNSIDCKVHSLKKSPQGKLVEETDLLFLDGSKFQTYKGLRRALVDFHPQVRRFIIIHDIQHFGYKAVDEGIGLFSALSNFLKEFPKWSVIKHYSHQYGLTVLGCQKQDKPELPSMITMAKNLATHAAEFVADGAHTVDEETYNKRLEICSLCEHRRDGQCSLCGCFLHAKAKPRVQSCDIGKWAENGV